MALVAIATSAMRAIMTTNKQTTPDAGDTMMFRNHRFQRAIASILLMSFGAMSYSPLMATESVKGIATTAGMIGGVPLIPLQPRNTGKGTLTTSAQGVSTITVGSSRDSNAGAKAANPSVSAAADKPVATPSTADYAHALAQLAELGKQPVPDASAIAQINLLRAQYRTVQQYEGQEAQAFAATEAHLRSKGLPAEILARHQAMVVEYTARNAELQAAMRTLDTAASNSANAQAALQQLAQVLAKYPNQSGLQAGKSGKLPWGNGQSTSKKVAMTPRAHERLFPRTVQVAAAGSLSGITLPDAILGETPLPADLAATDDVQLTPEIRALATSLSNNPMQIYNWVRNNIAFTPGYGAMQGAANTLQAKRGNAFDIASLLIAVYRAAGTPARYVYGTIEVPILRAQSWLNVDSAAAAQSLLTQAGIPNQAVMQAGQVSAVQLEHVWVEAFVDYTPSRGAINKTPDTWVPVDGSFKLDQSKAGMDLRGAISFNEAGLFDASKQGATCSADAAQTLNATAIQTAYAAYKTQLAAYLTQQGPDITIGDVLGSQTIVPENHPILLGSLPYKTIAQGATVNVLPDNLRWQFKYQLFADTTAQAQGQPTVALSGSMASLSGKRLTLSFAPATQADADTLASYLPKAHSNGSPIQASEFPATIPGYLIRVKAELRADGQVVASGGSFVLGSELVAEIDSYDPSVGNSGNWNVDTNTPHAGDYQAIAIDAQGVSAAQLAAVKARMAATQAALANNQNTLTRDDVTGDVLYHTALAYFATTDANSAVFQRAAGVVEQRLPSYGRAIAPALPQMLLGFVNQVSFPGVTLDIDKMSHAVAAKTNGLNAVAYTRQSNERNAAYAYLVLEKLYTNSSQPGEAVSAVKLLANAASQTQPAQPVYALTTANIASLLPNITLSAAAGTDVQNAVGAGYRVFVAQHPATIGAWSGEALQIEDLTTGAGAFRVRADNSGTNVGDYGAATAALYLQTGMGWLALAQPFQSGAAITPTLQAAPAIDDALSSMLDNNGNNNATNTRWSYFAGQADVANGLFLARLAAAQGSQPCDSVVGILAAKLDTATGFENPPALVAAPTITSQPVTAGQANQAYRYAVIASDPNNAALTYSVQAPTSMSVSAAGLVAWDNPVQGSFTITVRADNGKAYAEQTYILTVGNDAIPLTLDVGVSLPVINLNQSTMITVVTNGGSGAVTKTLKVDGQAVTLNASGQATVTGSTMGVHPIAVIATDSLGTLTKNTLFIVRNPADTTPPIAQIMAPLDDADVTAPVNIVGTASDANLAYYTLQIRPAGDTDPASWQEIGRGSTSVTNGVLGKLDPTQLQNTIYELLLTAVDINGQQSTALITLDVYRDLKIGQFSISFQDLNVDAVGVPIRVTRTYDTRKKGQSLDFGFGWSIDYQSVQIRKNMILGLQWEVTSSQFQLCLRPAGARKVNITLPTGKVERFTARNTTECAFGAVPPLSIEFNPLPGTTSQLEAINVPDLLVQGGMIYDADTFGPWNPKEFKLTTEDHYIYYLTEGIGIVRVKDPSGNTLDYGNNGIIHSNGQSVTFTRDPLTNRITAITDPSGKSINYVYSATGDLTSVTSRTDATSTFHYNRSHGLTDYTDPRGIMTARYVYDDDGRLIAAYDATGKAIETTHDTTNNQEIVKDRRGNVTTYTYDAAGNVTEVLNALLQKTKSTFDANGGELTTTNALDKTITRTFNGQSGKQLSEENPLHQITRWAYDSTTHTQLDSTTDARNNTTSYTYLNFGQNIVEPLGRSVLIRTDAGGGGNLNSLTVAGQTTNYTYNTKGNKTSETDNSGNVTTFKYDANNKETSRSWTRTVMVNGVAQQQTVTTSRELDAEGRVRTETDALGFTTKTEYNAGGQVTATVDPQGRRTTYEYDTRAKLAKTTYPDGSSDSVTYDEEGNQATTTDRQGRITQYEYDALNRLVKTIYPDGSTSGTEYDPAGRVAATTDARQQRTVNQYDDAGRLWKVTTPDLKTTTFGYDPNGNRTDVWDADSKHTVYEFDALNRLTKTTYPDTKFAITVWNVNGTKQSETDTASNTIVYGYDAMARLNSVTQTNAATNQVTAYGFDNLGNKTSQQDAENHITKWEYDAGNRVTSRTLPNGQKEKFDYDALGNLVTKTDFNGQATSIGYNNLAQPNLTVRPDGASVVTTYTATGQVNDVTVTPSATSGLQGGKTSYAYDAQDRLTKQTNPDGSFLAYGYDAAGNIVERSTTVGTVKYTYDPNGRLESVTDTSGKTTTYHYDAVGRPDTVGLPNGITSSYKYDDNGRLQQLVHQQSGGSIVAGVHYTLADNGQRTRLEEYDSQSTIAANLLTNPARTYDYQYDPVGRLTQDKRTDRGGAVVRTTTYLYDKVGNRKTRTEVTGAGTATTAYSYDANDRLTTETKTPPIGSAIVTTYAWDANGNLKSKTTNGQGTFYGWNADNRLIAVKQGATEATATIVATYTYDANGNRIGKTEPQNGKVTSYLTDSTFGYAQTVLETATQGASSTSTNYVWGNGLIAQNDGTQLHYTVADGLGSVKALTDATGNVTDTYQFEAFGNVENRTGTTANAYRFAGEYADDTTGHIYLRDRWLDPSVGRFISQDSFPGTRTRPVTLNRYLYASADPVNVRDPSGRMGLSELSVATDIQSILGNLQANFGFSFMNAAQNPNDVTGNSMALEAGFFLTGTILGSASKMVGSMFLKGRKFKVVSNASSTVLGENLELLGSLKCAGCQAHHLVPGTAKAAELGRAILKKHGIDINFPSNGVWLKGASSPAEWAGAVHNGRHLDEYGKIVSQRLKDADLRGGKEAVLEELNAIRNELFEGGELAGMI